VRPGHKACVQALIANRAIVTGQFDFGKGPTTLLHIACQNDDVDIAEMLLHAGVDPTPVPVEHSRSADSSAVDLLPASGAGAGEADGKPTSPPYVLFEAVRHGSARCVKLLLSRGLPPSIPMPGGSMDVSFQPMPDLPLCYRQLGLIRSM